MGVLENTSNCKACKNKIIYGARKCHHCGSSQTILAKLNDLSLVLSLTATLISLTALSAPVIKDLVISKKPVIEGVVLEGAGGTIQFALFNTGNAPTIIKAINVSYWLKNENEEDRFHTTHMLTGENIGRVIEPGKVHHMVARTKTESVLPFQLYSGFRSSVGELLEKDCVLEVIHHGLDDREVNTKIKYRCLTGTI